MSRSLIIVVGLGMLGVGDRVCAPEKERIYKGKTAREWMAILKDKKDRRSKDWVIATLGEMGPDARVAVPALIEVLKDKDLRVEAAAALGEIGPDAKAALPAMLQALRAEKYVPRNAITRSVALLGDAAVPALVEALEKGSDIDGDAAEALGYIGKPAVSHLVRLLKGKKARTRYLAASALGSTGAGPSVVKPLIDALRAPDFEVRFYAVRDLRRIGPAAAAAVPALVAADVPVGERLAALANIGEKGLPPLLQALSDKDTRVRAQAASSLGHRAVRGKAAVAALSRALEDNDAEVRAAAAMSLWGMGPVAKPAVPALAAALKDKSEDVRRSALLALGGLDR
jgi:HEAT repeat protein